MKDNKMYEIEKSKLDQVTGGSDRLSATFSPFNRRMRFAPSMSEIELEAVRRERNVAAELEELFREKEMALYEITPETEALQ